MKCTKLYFLIVFAIIFFIPSNCYAQNSSPYIQNEYLRIWPERVFPGIIDLFFNNNGTWTQYNNIVPIAKVNNEWANAELDTSHITTNLINSSNPIIIQYSYEPLSNGAHFYLTLTLNQNEKHVTITVTPYSNSLPIEAFSLGNYYGLQDQVRYVNHDLIIEDALTYPTPSGSHYQLGNFYFFPLPHQNIFRFRGESGIVQKQLFTAPFSELDTLVIETRYTPWLPEQTPPYHNWFETIHLTREPFTTENNTWIFGYESQLSGDTNLSGSVDIYDIQNLQQHYLQQKCDYLIDTNKDCLVDLFDYNQTIFTYGQNAN